MLVRQQAEVRAPMCRLSAVGSVARPSTVWPPRQAFIDARRLIVQAAVDMASGALEQLRTRLEQP